MTWLTVFAIFIGVSTSHLVQADSTQDLLASKAICGLQHSDDYEHTVNGTVLSQFPWLAIIVHEDEHDTENKVTNICSGSLINTKYVLSTGFCLDHDADDPYFPTGIRLGEYDLRNDTDCIVDNDQHECAESATVTHRIDKIILHPGHDAENHLNDIGLVRLRKKVKYSDYIRPICLPFPKTNMPKAGATLITSGWGRTSEDMYNGTDVQVKKITYSTLLTHEECSRRYTEMNIVIHDKLMCTVLIHDSQANVCVGDAGGPVMFTHKYKWYQIAIVSYGIGCDGKYPDVSTKVADYVDWIKETVEP